MENTAAEIKLLNQGIKYLERLHEIDISGSQLGDEVIYNLVFLGVEAVFTAMLLKYDCVIDHRDLFCLLREIEKQQNKAMPKQWVETSKLMSNFQRYCSLEVIKAKIPTKKELKEMFVFGEDVENYAKEMKSEF